MQYYAFSDRVVKFINMWWLKEAVNGAELKY